MKLLSLISLTVMATALNGCGTMGKPIKPNTHQHTGVILMLGQKVQYINADFSQTKTYYTMAQNPSILAAQNTTRLLHQKGYINMSAVGLAMPANFTNFKAFEPKVRTLIRQHHWTQVYVLSSPKASYQYTLSCMHSTYNAFFARWAINAPRFLAQKRIVQGTMFDGYVMGKHAPKNPAVIQQSGLFNDETMMSQIPNTPAIFGLPPICEKSSELKKPTAHLKKAFYQWVVTQIPHYVVKNLT